MSDTPKPENSHGTALDAVLDKAFEAQRLIKEERMIRTETPPDKITDQQAAAVIEAVKTYLKEKSVTQAQFANWLILAPSTVNQILKGTYAADARPIIAAMDRLLERRRMADAQPEINKFVWTDVAKMIRLAAQRAIAASDAGIDTRIALVWGDPGCGKTLALEAIAQSEDAIFITCDMSITTPRTIMERIGAALRIPLGGSMNEAFGNVVDRLRGSGKLILVDEIHALLDVRDGYPVFHALRRLSDATGCPQLWSATCNLIDQLRLRERKREPLGQIISRIGTQIHLTARLHGGAGGGKPEPLFTVEQVLQIFGANELRLTRDAGRFLARLCTSRMRGLLRTCTGLVMHATSCNRIAGAGEITAAMLWDAARLLFQPSVVAAMEGELREEISEMKLRLASA